MMVAKGATRIAIVHAGLPKTATTTLQNACDEARAILQKHGRLCYPGKTPADQRALRTIFLDDPRKHPSNLFKGRNNLDELLQEAEKLRDEFASQIRQSDARTILFSCEGLYNLKRPDLEKFKNWLAPLVDEIKVLLVAREPVAYATSSIQQVLKQGLVLDDLYQHPQVPFFKTNIGNQMAVFGADAVRVVTFEAICKHPEGVVGGFLDEIGVSDATARAAVQTAAKRDNESLSAPAAQILSSLNKARPAVVNGEKSEKRKILKEIRTLQKIKGGRFRLPEEVAQRVFEKTREDVAWLKENFGIDAYDEFPASVKGAPPPLEEEVALSIGLTISDLIANQRVYLDPEGSLAKGVTKKLRRVDKWFGGGIPGLRRFYR